MGKVFLVILVFLALGGCVTGTQLNTIVVEKGEDTPGLFTAIFAGRHYVEEVDAVVVMDLEGDEYTFVPMVKHHKDFEVLKSLTVPEAVYEAGPFFVLHKAFSGRIKLVRIQDMNGLTIGYEIRPLYDPAYMGDPDLVRTEYFLKPDKKVYFRNKARSIFVP